MQISAVVSGKAVAAGHTMSARNQPQTGWLPLAFALDWNRPPRQMNSTSFFYNHSSQWRYEKVSAQELLSPLADASKYSGHLIDFNVGAGLTYGLATFCAAAGA